MSNNKKVFAIIAFICGIASMPLGCVAVGGIVGIAAIVLGIVSLVKKENGKVFAIIGIVTGVIGSGIGGVMASSLGSSLTRYLGKAGIM